MVTRRYVYRQVPVIASMGRTALVALARGAGVLSAHDAALPGPLLEEKVSPLPRGLVDTYIRAVGGDPKAYRGQLPAHLFPQWGFALAARTLEHASYPLLQVVNGGCRLEIHHPLPDNVPLTVTAQLAGIDDDGRRAVFHQIVTTGTPEHPEAVVAHLFPIVVHRGADKPSGSGAAKRERPSVPEDAREIMRWRLRPSHAVDFARLTGDYNPVHWSPAYARAFGFKRTILHGFATMARAIEGLHQNLYSGATPIRTFDARFTRPLTLPAHVALFQQPGDGGPHEAIVGDGPGGFAYMVASYEV